MKPKNDSVQDILSVYPDEKMFDMREASEIIGITRDSLSARINRRNGIDKYYIRFLSKSNRGSRGSSEQYLFPKSEVSRMIEEYNPNVAKRKSSVNVPVEGRDGYADVVRMVKRWAREGENVSIDLIRRIAS